MKKKILGLSVLVGAIALGSCSKNEQIQEPQIVKVCNGLICSFAVQDVQMVRYTNLLGKSIDKVVKRTDIKGPQDSITWTIPDGTPATSSQLLSKGLTPCLGGDTCSFNENPTGAVFTTATPKEVSVSGTIVNPDGSVTEINKEESISIDIGQALINVSREAQDLNYDFSADIADTGIPEDATLTWFVDRAIALKKACKYEIIYI